MKQLVLRGASSATTVVLTLWGYVELTSFLFDRLPFAWALTAAIAALVLIVVAILASPALLLARYLGATPFESDRIYVRYDRTVTVHSNWRATVEISREIVFLTPPRERDLWDAFSVAEGQTLAGFHYASPDATEIERRQTARNRLIVFWKPSSAITPLTVYRHQTTSEPPILYNDRILYSEFHCIGKVGVFEETVRPPFVPAEVVAFPRPRFRRFKDSDALVRYAREKGPTITGAQPSVQADSSISWRIEGPTLGASYVLVALSAAERDARDGAMASAV